MVLFSESFQYIPMTDSIPGALKLLNPNGYIMVCDFFQTDAPGKSMLGGGHKYSEWEAIKNTLAVETLVEKDITEFTAPTIDLVDQFNRNVLKPVWDNLFLLGEDRFPSLIKLVKWKYKKKFEKMENKHFSGKRNGAEFKKYKKYMFYLFQAKQ